MLVKPGSVRGYTLLELLCIFAIASLLLASGTPGFVRLLREQRLSAAVTDFQAALLLARSEALRRGVRVDLAAQDGDWRRGWVVLVDRNRNGQADAGDEIIQRHGPLSEDITISAKLTDMSAPYIAYSPAGRSRGNSGAAQSGSWTFACGQERRKLILNLFGRPRSCNPDRDQSNCA
jgi:type IV fimbrial biogenesis protein FimT